MSNIVEWYNDIMYNRVDPRTQDFLFMSGPGPLIMLLVTYIYFCTSAGPRYMRDKKPYELKYLLIAHNLLHIVLSIYLFYEASLAWLFEYNYSCQLVDYSDNPKAVQMAKAVHFFLICKILELLDTVFFILRKKTRQVSFLHVYHHALMPICAWIGARYFTGGHATFLGFINSFIHIIMYTYYLLACFGPQMQKYLWWKKYLTWMQLVQFVAIFIHNAQMFFNDCKAYPKIFSVLLCVNSLFFVYLFGSFYIRAYTATESEKKKSKIEASRKEPQNNCQNNSKDE